MSPRIALVHTVPSLAELFDELLHEAMPEAETHSVVAEHLLQRTIADGRLGQETMHELAGIVDELRGRADLVMVTCSTLGPAVDALPDDGAPVLRVDEAMARRAVRTSPSVGVLATLSSTLEPTTALVERVAADEGREVDVVALLCEGAFEAISDGDGDRHDALVRAGLEQLTATVGVVVLAQASMARVVSTLPYEPTVPILSSPRLAVDHIADLLAEA